MNLAGRILLVGDYSDKVVSHLAIPTALARAAGAALATTDFEAQWLATADIKSESAFSNASAIWVVPNSPYKNMDGALLAIRYARENKIPFLGTCGGFQHAIIEYARNVLGLADADHTESNPAATTPIIAKLECALINKSESISLRPGSRLRQLYDADQITEAYQCSYGVNASFENRLRDGKLSFTAYGATGEVRALELADHPFFVATLFQPERSAAPGAPHQAHPVVTAFVQAALQQPRSNT